MVRECQICGLDKNICRDHKRVIAPVQCTVIFFIMDAVFGSGIALAIAARAWSAIFIFTFAAVMSVVLVVKN